MKNSYFASAILLAVTLIALLSGCSNAGSPAKHDVSKGIFPEGNQGPATTFTGKVYYLGLVEADSIYTTAVGNVYFEPGARSHWHTHPAGQILVITDGVGYHQIKGQPRQTLHKGDIVKCPPNTLHWHGASQDTGMQQMYILPNTGKGIVDWKEAVTDEVYNGN
ncbi:cupin domain-containing protein [bacterium]|nr:cupin domain-containing protein [bacterium]